MEEFQKESHNKIIRSILTLIIIMLFTAIVLGMIFQLFINSKFEKRMVNVEGEIENLNTILVSAIERDINYEISINDKISDDDICNTIDISFEELEEIKKDLELGKSYGTTESEFNTLKSYIMKSNEKYTNQIYEELYTKSDNEAYSKWFAYMLSGMINHHLGGDITAISFDINGLDKLSGTITIDSLYKMIIYNKSICGVSVEFKYNNSEYFRKSYSYGGPHSINLPNSTSSIRSGVSFDKPIVYLYPTQEQNVSVKLGNPELLTCSYPRYDEGWNVLAQPNGDLLDLKTGNNLYSLYWEGISNKVYDYSNTPELEGFVVKGEDTIRFLEEKLSILGLNEKEREEFIIYWLPQMEDNKYNYIRFETKEEIDEEMPLQIEPKPDTTIRGLMDWKKLDEAIEVKEQELIQVERSGYTVVEWGASVLNENIVR